MSRQSAKTVVRGNHRAHDSVLQVTLSRLPKKLHSDGIERAMVFPAAGWSAGLPEGVYHGDKYRY